MAYDQIFTFQDQNGAELKIVPVALNLDKSIYLLHIFEEDHSAKKKFIRNELVIVGKHILTSTFSDTIHFFEELKLFDYGNDQNKYLNITEYKSTKNLKLKHDPEKNIFISKSEAQAMYKIFNLAFQGYSVAAVLENEFRFTPQMLTKLLHEQKFLVK
ncbi:MAG: hypothetical protein IE909_08625 [Campylobacterales bacterium]|nr:hypothetical protein [Campylobacterales bacterium]